MILRVRKEDSAYLHKLLESYEGLANNTTLPGEKGLAYRDIALHVAPDLRQELDRVLAEIRKEIPLEIFE